MKKVLLILWLLTISLASVSVSYSLTIKQITHNFYNDWYPQINNHGYVVWYEFDGTDNEIFLYDGMNVKQLTHNSYGDLAPQINDNGYVVWVGFDGKDNEIFLYDGMNVKQLTHNSYREY